MAQGKLIFVSGLTGAGKTTLVGEALKTIDNLEVLLTYTTRPKRAGEENSYEYVFVDEEAYQIKKSLSSNWDETTYNGYKYASDAEKYIDDLNVGRNVIVSVTPNMEDIRAMTQIYKIQPVTIWIDTDRDTAASRVSGDKLRSQRQEDDNVKQEFDIIFAPTGNLREDSERFIALIYDTIR
jgi:guanylate kinase